MPSVHEAALMPILETPGGQRCGDAGKNLPSPVHEPDSLGTEILPITLPRATDPRMD